MVTYSIFSREANENEQSYSYLHLVTCTGCWNIVRLLITLKLTFNQVFEGKHIEFLRHLHSGQSQTFSLT